MKNRNIVKLLFMVYLALLLWMTVFREGFSTEELFSKGDFNLEIFTDLIRIYYNDKSVFYYLFLGNILTFIPFGFFTLPLISRHKKKLFSVFLLTVFAGFIFSFCIEMSQWAFGVGVSEIDDLILNTSGVFIGALFSLPFYKKLRK